MSPFCIYYGWLCDGDAGEPNDRAQRIAAARVPLVIAHFWTAAPQRHRNVSEAVLALLHAAGSEVFAYIETGGGSVPPGIVRAKVDEYLDGGADGIFFDEADPLREDTHLAYYAALADRVRADGKRLILNPGVAQCGERTMDVADFLMVEHRWRDLRTGSVWSGLYPADRFMGVSSNEENAMGYEVTQARAIADTLEAPRRRIGWHTSTDLYTKLPGWFERYIDAVRPVT